MRFLSIAVLFAFLSPCLFAQQGDAKRIAEVQEELAKARTKVASLESELAKLKIGDRKPQYIFPGKEKAGDVLWLAQGPKSALDFRVVRIIGPAKMEISLDRWNYLVDGFPTKGIVDRQLVQLPGVYEVDTEKTGDRTLLVFRLISK